MKPTGYVHVEPSITERCSSALRSSRVEQAFTPSNHPPFGVLFGDAWTQYVNACTGFALVKGASVMAKLLGLEYKPLSAFSVYTPARIRRDGRAGLVDEGARTADCVWAWNEIGACEEWRWPSYSLDRKQQIATVNSEPQGIQLSGVTADAMRWRRKLPIRLNRIVATGPRLVQRMLHSLHLQQYVILALPVGDEFDRGVGVIPPQQAKRGTHLVGLLDWRVRDGQYEGLLGNSWGWAHGEDGRLWASSGLLAQARAAYYFEGIG